MVGSQYVTLGGFEQSTIVYPNNAIKMFIIFKNNSISNIFTNYNLMNVCFLMQGSQGSKISLSPEMQSITKSSNIIDNKAINYVMNAYGDVSEYINNTTQLESNVINFKNEDITCNYLGLNINIDKMQDIIDYYGYTQSPEESTSASFAYVGIISLISIIVLIVVFIFIYAIINMYNKSN